ncbi:MAG: PAS domain-containing sensor histidine kinase [Chloroflexi bacterium]|nr:PAS domain-containing sensor histidine kinase [Chloroflexota bacterium]
MTESHPPRRPPPDPEPSTDSAAAWLGAYFNATPDVLLVLDVRTGIIRGANPAASRLLGYAPDSLPGMHFSALLPPNTASANTPLGRRFPLGGEVSESQLFHTAGGAEVPCDVQMTALAESEQAVLHLRDVSPREAMRHARSEADRAAMTTAKTDDVIRGIEQYMSHVSHELRTPMAVILSSSSMLERYYARLDEAKRAEHFSRIQAQIRYLTEFLDNLRYLSRLNAGQVRAQPDPTDITTAIHDLLAEFASDPQHPHFGLTLEGGTAAVKIDPTLWRRALQPVIQNAVRYGPFGATVEVTVIRRYDSLEVTVTDHGPGLPAEYLPAVFEVFRRGENAREINGGGLGLAIASRCAALMGGTLTFETQAGAGTSFTLSVPT